MVKPSFVKIFIVALIPDEVRDGWSGIGSGIGALNLYLCEWSRGSNLNE